MEDTRNNNKIELEYTLNTAPVIIYSRLSTPSGLAEWFADDVKLSGKIYTFIWDKSQQKAELVEKKENKYVKFKWLKEGSSPKNYFMFRIHVHELTGEVALQLTEILDNSEDKEDAISLWNYQIGELKRVLGV